MYVSMCVVYTYVCVYVCVCVYLCIYRQRAQSELNMKGGYLKVKVSVERNVLGKRERER